MSRDLLRSGSHTRRFGLSRMIALQGLLPLRARSRASALLRHVGRSGIADHPLSSELKRNCGVTPGFWFCPQA